jgi:four helix bundle protein
MKKPSILREKSFTFSLQIIELCRFLKESNKEYVVYRQLLRSGTAVGALIREAEFAQSKADFINKLSVALKEANETEYWLELLRGSQSLQNNTNDTTMTMLTEIIKMLVASINTAKGNKV